MKEELAVTLRICWYFLQEDIAEAESELKVAKDMNSSKDRIAKLERYIALCNHHINVIKKNLDNFNSLNNSQEQQLIHKHVEQLQ